MNSVLLYYRFHHKASICLQIKPKDAEHSENPVTRLCTYNAEGVGARYVRLCAQGVCALVCACCAVYVRVRGVGYV